MEARTTLPGVILWMEHVCVRRMWMVAPVTGNGWSFLREVKENVRVLMLDFIG